jgi:hypothetical protein
VSARPIVLFVLRFLIVNAVLLLAWPLLDGAYSALFRGVGNACVGPLFAGTDAEVSLSRYKRGSELADTKILIASRSSAEGRVIPVSSRMKGYLPMALLVSLILAMPGVASRRTLRALVLGLLLAHAFLALRLAAAVLHELSLPNGYAILRPGPVLRELIRMAWILLYKSAGFAWGVSVVIWVLLCVRSGEVVSDETR